METSIIIRTKNEEKWIGAVLEKLAMQTYKDFEIIVVDSGSTDKTLEIVKKFDTRIFYKRPEEFSFPSALNFGCRETKAEKYFVLLSAHSLPISDDWLKEGINSFVADNVMGVFGPMLALPDASIWEKIFYSGGTLMMKIRHPFGKYLTIKKPGMGVLGFTHSIIRKDLWQKHNFDEKYGLGGEDAEWMRYWFERGYVVIFNKKCAVRHSHGLTLKNFLRQYRYWKIRTNRSPSGNWNSGRNKKRLILDFFRRPTPKDFMQIMRRNPLVIGEYYHIYNRGVEKRKIFLSNKDYERFLISMKEFNQVDPIFSLYRHTQEKRKHDVGVRHLQKLVEVVCYCLNPNHIHFIFKQLAENGVSEFMKRLGGGYTNYFNHHYKRSGVLFQGKFKSVHIKTNPQLLYLSAYVNRNHFVHGYGDDFNWSYSSLRDYIGKRDSEICCANIIEDEKYLLE